MEFPLLLKAVEKADNHQWTDQWAIGDALIAECGPPSERGDNDGSFGRIAEASKYLVRKGHDAYTVGWLRQIRETAWNFRNATDRDIQIAWGAYRAAATPEYLKAIIAGAQKGTKITQDYIEGIRRVQAEHARQEREEQNRKATAAREKAEAEEAAALKRVRDAEEAAEKEAAQAEAKKAARRTERAKEKEQETKVAPRKKAGAPKPEEVPQLVAEMTFMANASRSVVLARQAVKDLQSCLDQLSPKGAKALTSAAIEAANAWSDAAHAIRNGVGGQQDSHLSVVGE